MKTLMARNQHGAIIWLAIFLGFLALGAYLPKPCSVYPLECKR